MADAKTGEILLNAFVGPETVPIQAAGELGLFAAEGVAVRCIPTPSSIRQMVGLIDGEFHMASTAIDNVIAYDEGQGAAPTQRTPDLVGFLGTATDPRRLVAAPGVASFAALKGQRIAVDAPSTGFSFLLNAMLEEHGGLARDDYTLVPAGNLDARLAALRSGDCVAALLGTEHAEQAVAMGFRRLDPVPDPWDGYQGAVYCADRAWLAAHRPQVIGVIRALLAATDWVLDPANAAALPAMIARHLPGITAADAATAAARLQGPGSLLKPGLPISVEGTRRVLDLRARYAIPPKALGAPETYLDLSYYRAATGA